MTKAFQIRWNIIWELNKVMKGAIRIIEWCAFQAERIENAMSLKKAHTEKEEHSDSQGGWKRWRIQESGTSEPHQLCFSSWTSGKPIVVPTHS